MPEVQSEDSGAAIGAALADLTSDLRGWLEVHNGLAAGPSEGALPSPSRTAEDEVVPVVTPAGAAVSAEKQRDILFIEDPGRHPGGSADPSPIQEGPAADLLTKIINNVLRVERAAVAVCSSTSPSLWQDIDAIRPKVVVTLGPVAAQTLLQSQESLEQLRAQSQTVHGIPLVPTYHPTYLLSHPAQKRQVFEDMKRVRGLLEEATGCTLQPIARTGGAKS